MQIGKVKECRSDEANELLQCSLCCCARLECLAWIFSAESRVLFFAPLAPEQLAQFRPAFDKIVQSAKLP